MRSNERDDDGLTEAIVEGFIDKWYGVRLADGIIAMARKWARLVKAGREEEAAQFLESMLPSLLRRAIVVQERFYDGTDSVVKH